MYPASLAFTFQLLGRSKWKMLVSMRDVDEIQVVEGVKKGSLAERKTRDKWPRFLTQIRY